ncbi:MAG: TPD domain-containing protein [Thermoplasmata archaeon]
MYQKDYINIARQIGSFEEIPTVARRLGLNEELVLVIYTQKVSRDVKHRYYIIKKQLPVIKKEWDAGRSLCELGRKYGDFPPLLLGFMLFTANGTTRRQFWGWVRDAAKIEDPRIKKEIEEAAEADIVYSPNGMEIQKKRGKVGEEKLYMALDERNIDYRTEKDLVGKVRKTPDALLLTPLRVGNFQINWIESKANFGDVVEVRHNTKKQFCEYVKLFGSGVAVYWFGLVKDFERTKGVWIFDENGFYTLLRKAAVLPRRKLKFLGDIA